MAEDRPPFGARQPWTWSTGISKRVIDVANATTNTYFSFLDETESSDERVLRVWWDELGAYAAGDREVAFLRVIMSGNGVAESGPSNGYFYEAPVQGLAVRIPPGRCRVDVRFNDTGAAITPNAQVYGRIDPGRVAHRRAIAKGVIGLNTLPVTLRQYDPHSDPNARFASSLVVQTFGIGTVDMLVPSGTTYTLPANTTVYVDARGKITLTPAINSVGYNCFWDIFE